ncbi:hypothetical protein MesoLj131b_07770 [Mesorhizobium sp. 131-2-5]|uniref:hypothetical protein n=1 Tax=Mesorhizobium sp. 131-2-5 TaxID=2744519 RepID=UPI0019284652|nr:hypothetical protein [Mesorhizobium sp. 131-2-5]BCG98777.1 hypothetical protein MesoLj131b_07770 [Mesorhizobium sp. 131-2-5]
MQILLDQGDLAKLSPAARAEILSHLSLNAPSSLAVDTPATGVVDYEGIDMTDVVELDEQQIRFWMEAAKEKTKLGLRVIAEHGPVLDASLLNDAGIENISHFQSRTTIRTRTVTKNKRAFMFGWNEGWHWEGNRAVGRYAVREMTHRSLRKYFNLD